MPNGSYQQAILYRSGKYNRPNRCSRLTGNGLVFEMQPAEEYEQGPQRSVDLRQGFALAKRVITAAIRLCELPDSEEPGYLMVSMGLLNVRHTRLHWFGDASRSRNAFLDDQYRSDYFTQYGSLLSAPHVAVSSLVQDVMYSFDMPCDDKLAERIKTNWDGI